MTAQIDTALDFARRYGQTDGAHHKLWVIDQMVRALCGDEEGYRVFIQQYREGEDGPETYSWDTGTPP